MDDNFDSSDINILIVGETGVGKSTFINAFANYIKFRSFDTAAESTDIISLISSNFVMTDENYKEIKIKCGDDPNECNKPGASSTMESRLYKIPFKDRSLILIDTPGVGDTNGIKKDEENMQDIMAMIAEFKHLHAILILLQPNESRVSVHFKYCIKELLSSLEKSAAQNIIFVFTSSRGSLFRPGLTCTPLKVVLKEIQDKPPKVKIPFTDYNTFCMENDVFQFLIAKKYHKFPEDDIKSYKQSWKKSSSETFRLLKFIKGLKPHNLQGTVSVNNSRALIMRLCKPLADITQNINDNINQLENQRILRENTSLSFKELQEKLVVKRIRLRINKIDKPKTVCAHKDCVEYSKVDGASTVLYPQICHVECKRKGVEKNIIGDSRLSNCWAFKTKSGECRHPKCKHTYLDHLHIYYEAEPYEYEDNDEEVIKKMCTTEDAQADIDKKMEKIKSVIKDYRNEQDVIQRVMADFFHFLKHNAITHINDAYKDYIMYYIDLEEKKGSDRTKIKYYHEMIAQHENRVKSLEQNLKDANEDALTRTNSVVTSAHVQKLKHELFSLPMYGQTIRDALKAQREARSNNQIQITMGDHLDSSDINILIVGETGVGKSTFVNSFVNYIKFNTFDEAVESEDIISVIPSNFTITDHNFKETQIKFGEDPNEFNQPGASSTQQTRVYKVPYNNRRSVVLIDTAGVGDTSGVKMDEENLQNILATIAKFKHLHAILILLHPNESSVNVLFTYYIKKLLSSLEKSAAQNIVFVFTHSRGTFYRPGGNVRHLRAVLNEIENKPPNVKVQVNGTNTFCVDNEAFRFLIAKKNGIKFLQDDINAFGESWNRSAKITFKMLEYIQGLKPHNIQGTLSVNAARTLIIRLSGPLAQITQNIIDNIKKLNQQQSLRANSSLSLKELRKKLVVKRIGLNIKKIAMPRTVCGHKICVKYSDVNGASTVTYPQICHAACKQKGLDEEIFGKPRLMHCSAFKSNFMPGRICRHCKHSYLHHMHIYYEAEPYEYDGRDEVVSQKIVTEEEEQKEIQKQMAEIRSTIIAYKSEQMVIQRVMANFAHFLKHNAITPFNDAYKNYITYYIEMENSNGADREKIAYYERLLAEYEESIKTLDLDLERANNRAPRITNSVVSSADVEELKNELLSLRMSGQTIREALDAQRKARYNNQVDFVFVDTGKGYNTKKY